MLWHCLIIDLILAQITIHNVTLTTAYGHLRLLKIWLRH